MDTQFQDLQWVVIRATKEFKDNPKRRISALFRDFRKNSHFSLFGDFFLLWAIAKAMDTLKLPRHRRQFYTAARQSKEFNETSMKGKWLDTLVGRLE